MSDVTRILSRIEQGDPSAPEQLLPLVYSELRQLAAAKLAQEDSGHTLQPTALVHDAYVRLVDVDKAQHWNSQGHFFAAAAEAMRRILVESARRKKRVRHGAGHIRVELTERDLAIPERSDDLVALDAALSRLEEIDAVAAAVVKLRFFVGMTVPQTAKTLNLSVRTAERNWTYARTWLHRELDSESGDPCDS